MKQNENFDCVKFQRDVRKEMLEEAEFDLKILSQNIKNSLKDNDLYNYFMKRKYEAEKLKTS